MILLFFHQQNPPAPAATEPHLRFLLVWPRRFNYEI